MVQAFTLGELVFALRCGSVGANLAFPLCCGFLKARKVNTRFTPTTRLEQQREGEHKVRPYMLLSISNLDVFYGVIQATARRQPAHRSRRDRDADRADGAGKTTLLRTISGLLRPARGSIRWNAQDGTALRTGAAADQSPSSVLPYEPAPPDAVEEWLAPHEVVRQGISHVPEGRQIFANLTVIDNLMLGAYQRNDKDGIRRDLDRALSLFPILAERRRQAPGH